MQPILEIKSISKKFRIRHENQPYLSLRDSLVDFFKPKTEDQKSKTETFWALKDVSFDVYPGESIGIIGKNGAGKSTLLKILSKITPPTEGKIISRGRIASLLEVGTGFHPELSGRENIFLNGSILGMKRKEILKKFDEIVDFSGVEKFLDTPLKHYSSGMQLRLAFAVAAFLEPEILLIDEVLAVGDAEFQRKCLGKMEDVTKREGRTVLFVSHNMGMVGQLCKKSLCLNKGCIVFEGKTDTVIDYYLNQNNSKVVRIKGSDQNKGNKFMLIYLTDSQLADKIEYKFDEEIIVGVELHLPEFSKDLELAMRLVNKHGSAVFTIHEKLDKYYKKNNTIKLNIIIPSKFITPGRYSWTMCINHAGLKNYDLLTDILPFIILETGSEFARYDGSDYGSVFAKYSVQNLSK